MQVQAIRLHTVELAISADLRLSLVEVALGARLTVELLDLGAARIEQVAVVRLLV